MDIIIYYACLWKYFLCYLYFKNIKTHSKIFQVIIFFMFFYLLFSFNHVLPLYYIYIYRRRQSLALVVAVFKDLAVGRDKQVKVA
jgi:hypothetical protein